MSETKDLFKKHEKDTGSTGLQIVALSEEIKALTVHMGVNKKDYSCRRTLLKNVAKRRTFLTYLKRTDEQTYKKVVDALAVYLRKSLKLNRPSL